MQDFYQSRLPENHQIGGQFRRPGLSPKHSQRSEDAAGGEASASASASARSAKQGFFEPSKGAPRSRVNPNMQGFFPSEVEAQSAPQAVESSVQSGIPWDPAQSEMFTAFLRAVDERHAESQQQLFHLSRLIDAAKQEVINLQSARDQILDEIARARESFQRDRDLALIESGSDSMLRSWIREKRPDLKLEEMDVESLRHTARNIMGIAVKTG